jgi:hypothetical protein
MSIVMRVTADFATFPSFIILTFGKTAAPIKTGYLPVRFDLSAFLSLPAVEFCG